LGRGATARRTYLRSRAIGRLRPRSDCSAAHCSISGRSHNLTRPLPRSMAGRGISTGDLACLAAAMHRDDDVQRLPEIRRIIELEADRERLLVPSPSQPAPNRGPRRGPHVTRWSRRQARVHRSGRPVERLQSPLARRQTHHVHHGCACRSAASFRRRLGRQPTHCPACAAAAPGRSRRRHSSRGVDSGCEIKALVDSDDRRAWVTHGGLPAELRRPG
jgi:hypothetical protein